jgi:hypothetical protein
MDTVGIKGLCILSFDMILANRIDANLSEEQIKSYIEGSHGIMEVDVDAKNLLRAADVLKSKSEVPQV